MQKAAEYRLYAKECRASATQIGSGELRDRLFTIALEWEQLADQHERRLALPQSASDETKATKR